MLYGTRDPYVIFGWTQKPIIFINWESVHGRVAFHRYSVLYENDGIEKISRPRDCIVLLIFTIWMRAYSGVRFEIGDYCVFLIRRNKMIFNNLRFRTNDSLIRTEISKWNIFYWNRTVMELITAIWVLISHLAMNHLAVLCVSLINENSGNTNRCSIINGFCPLN